MYKNTHLGDLSWYLIPSFERPTCSSCLLQLNNQPLNIKWMLLLDFNQLEEVRYSLISIGNFWELIKPYCIYRTSLVAQTVKNLPAVQETRVQSLGWEDPLEKEMATHSSVLAWKIPWTGKPSGLQPLGLQRVGHDWATNTFTFTLWYIWGS